MQAPVDERERAVTDTVARQVRARATAPRSRGARQVARCPTGAKRAWWASAQIKRRALATATVQYTHKKIPRGHFFYPKQPPPRRPCVGAPASAMSVAPSGSATKERATGKQLPSICPSAPPSPDSPKSAGWQPPGAWAANFALNSLHRHWQLTSESAASSLPRRPIHLPPAPLRCEARPGARFRRARPRRERGPRPMGMCKVQL